MGTSAAVTFSPATRPDADGRRLASLDAEPRAAEPAAADHPAAINVIGLRQA
ncbi:hypothetical protein [Arthrobacter sp. B3I4]|uniref:hypothetical protein n=1 Tax=Arthrobacter sp. B3I4 TaxID=3042267 RepID=UPI0027847DBE|nr:hypothetical protein [Arthrobacter sp. B3I4]MDQ0756963.1 hypothetical protein [Arthrobacter sp. B3I4]